MFYLIGLGLKPAHLTLEAKEAVARCGRVFIETYTSAYSEGSVEELAKIIGKNVVKLDRHGVEEGFESVFKEAKRGNEDFALLVFGNPLSATTHVQLLLDAKRGGVPFKVIAGISVFDFLGATGLDQYRFGRTCTIVAPKPNYEPESFYEMIEKNFNNGLHTLCLLDIEAERGKMLTVGEALGLLQKIEKKKGGSMLQKATLVGLYALGSAKQVVKSGSLAELQRSSYGLFPQALVIAAELNEKEEEALGELHG